MEAGECKSSPDFYMSISAIFYQFNKKPNSTKVPSSGGTTYNIELLNDCSLVTPMIKLRGSSATDNLGRFNFAYISDFGRYYFVKDVTYNSDLGCWNMSLKSDVLASKKSDIVGSTQFVERSFSRHNLMIPDDWYISDGVPEYSNTVASNFFDATPSNGYYIIGMTSTGTGMSRFGGIQYYILTSADMSALVDYMMGTSNYTGATITEISQDLLGFLADPLQYIVSCKFIPRLDLISASDLSNMVYQPIKFGPWVAPNVNGYLLPSNFLNPSPVIRRGFTMQLTDHPQKVTRGGWLNGNSTTERVLRFEPWGSIALDCSRLVNLGYVYLDVAIDIVTGDGILSIYGCENPSTVPVNIDTLPLVSIHSAPVLIDIPLSQTRHEGFVKMAMDNFINPAIGRRESATQGFLGGFTTGGLAGGTLGALSSFGSSLSVTGGINKAYDLINNFYGAPQSQGTAGSLLCRMPVVIFNKFMNLVSEDLAEFGRPLCSYTTLTNLTGFTKCSNANISTSLTEPEDREIEGFLNGGFFIE